MARKTDKKLNLIWEWERNVFSYYLYLFAVQFKDNPFALPVFIYMVYEHGNADCYLDGPSLEIAANDVLKKIKKDKKHLRNFTAQVYKTGSEVHSFCRNLRKKDLLKLSSAQLKKLYKKSTTVYLNHVRAVGLIRDVNRALTNELEKNVKAKIRDNKKANKILADLFLTEKKSFTAEADIDFLNLILKIKGFPASAISLINKYYNKYFWLNVGYGDNEPLSREGFLKEVSRATKKSGAKLKKELKEINQQPGEIKKHIKQALREIRPSQEVRRLIKFASTCTFFKDFTRGNLNHLHYANQLLFSEIGNRLDLSWREVAHFTPPEMDKIFKNWKKPNLRGREEMVLCSDKKRINIILGEKAKILKKKIADSQKAGNSEISGTVVCPGLVRGRALVIHKAEHYYNQKVKDNFILITSMTTPDLIFLIKKAKAIVTDEGGLTCHAAIVARELKRPCIIGTRNATKILKDGDLIELDANKGTIKILK